MVKVIPLGETAATISEMLSQQEAAIIEAFGRIIKSHNLSGVRNISQNAEETKTRAQRLYATGALSRSDRSRLGVAFREYDRLVKLLSSHTELTHDAYMKKIETMLAKEDALTRRVESEMGI